MILVSVNRIRACKKLVLYFRFLETAARQISECKGQFELLPESSQASSMNLAFSSDYLDIKEIREFGTKIKVYFQNSPAFYHMAANQTMVDPELRNHCEAVKLQRGPMKELAVYYISYMDRMGKEADPRVKEKLQKGLYPDTITPVQMGGPGLQANAFNHPGGINFGSPVFPAPPGGPSNEPIGGGFQMNAGAGGGFGNSPFGNQGGFGGAHQGGFGNAPQGGFGNGPQGGFGGVPQGGFGNAPQGGFGNNPFGVAQQPGPGGFGGYGGGHQGTPFGQAGPAQGSNPFSTGGQQQAFAKGQPTTQPSPYTPPVFGAPPIQNIDNQYKFDDVFADPTTGGKKNDAFGGDKKPGNQGGSGDTTDDFLKQLEDLKKL